MGKITEFTNPSEFQRFCSLLLSAEYADFQAIDDSGGDLGIDGYIPGSTIYMIYCPEKPQRNTTANQKKKISSDIEKAVKTIKEKNLSVHTLIFVTPANLRAEVILYLEEKSAVYSLKGISYGEDKLTELMSKHPHVQKQFPLLVLPDLASEVAEIKDGVSAIKETFQTSSQQIESEEEKDIFAKEPRLKEALKNYENGNLDDFLKISREIYYETINDRVKLQAILNITFNAIIKGNNSELICMCEEGIKITEKIESLNKKATLMARKAELLEAEINMLKTNMWFQEQIAERIGIFDEYKYSFQLQQAREKAKEVDQLLQHAVDIATSNKFYWTLAGIYTIVGNMAANTYITVSKTKPNLMGFYDNRCKTAYSEAKKIYTLLGYEEGILSSVLNLANHLKATDEIELSKKYTQDVLKKAKEKGFAVLALKASEIIYSMEHMTPADYALPPDKFLEKMKERRKAVLENLKKES